MQNVERPTIVTGYGGGHGLAMVLSAAHEALPPEAEINGVVTTYDNGGSSGRLRAALGIQPVGDISCNILATSRHPDEAERLLDQRFNKDATLSTVQVLGEKMLAGFGYGDSNWARSITDSTKDVAAYMLRRESTLEGHSLRNLTLAALADTLPNMTAATRVAEKLWRARAKIFPITHDIAELILRDGDVTKFGEDEADSYDVKDPHNVQVLLDRAVTITPGARNALTNTDVLISTPGSFTTSVLALLATPGAPEAIQGSHAKHIVTMPSPQQHLGSGDMTATDWVDAIQKRTRRSPTSVILDSMMPVRNKPIARPADATYLAAKGIDVHDKRLVKPASNKPANPNDEVARRGLRGDIHYDTAPVGKVIAAIACRGYTAKPFTRKLDSAA